MHLLIGLGIFVAVVAAMEGPRFRPWVVGSALIGCGFLLDVAYLVWVADWAGRVEMGIFAFHEAMLFLAGLGCILVSLAMPAPRGAKWLPRVMGWIAWLATGLAAAYTVLNRLPS